MARKRPPPPPKPRLYGPHFLREWRVVRKMTLEAVGEVVGLSHAQLQRIETRKQKYNQELLEKLSALYKVPVVWLIERDPRLEEQWREIDRFKEYTLGQANPN